VVPFGVFESAVGGGSVSGRIHRSPAGCRPWATSGLSPGFAGRLSSVGLRCPWPVPWPSDPPRCCVDLQRVTADRSRFVGFPAPPAPFSLSGWTLACSGQRLSRSFLWDGFAAHGLSFTLEDLDLVFVRASRPAHDRRVFGPSILPGGFPPLRRSQSGGSLSRSALRAPNDSVAFRYRPRRGFPCPRGPPSPFSAALAA
jgi:hypothetical protein